MAIHHQPKFEGTSQPPHMRTGPHFHERAPEVHIQSSGGRKTSGQVRIPTPLTTCGQLLSPSLEGVFHTLLFLKGHICHNDDEGLRRENREPIIILGPNLVFVHGLVKFVPAAARLVCPDLLGSF